VSRYSHLIGRSFVLPDQAVDIVKKIFYTPRLTLMLSQLFRHINTKNVEYTDFIFITIDKLSHLYLLKVSYSMLK